ncbi:cytochrome o ubiquinol oxidase subunit IV [Fictibacillus sp. Mic-4]|uniref:cytochrome o ubiquinol oxidase subunit IV n=1 Tax=Fictibacillus TaxID=1329200 RepID=UPI0003F8B28A|nr:cytochrome o ubiquinol oxidase subunit IV [Fictibacillus gelatini]
MESEKHHGSLKAYVTGFIASIVLTIIPLLLVVNHTFKKGTLTVAILGMAICQLFVQLFFFMHLKDEKKPRYNAMALVLGIIFVFTIVAGSIWIMSFNEQVH